MSNNGKWLGFSLLLLTLLVVPASGQAPEAKPDDQLKQLTVLVVKLQQSIDDLKKQLESTPTEVSVDTQIRKALASTQADLFALRKQVEQLQRDVDALKTAPRVAKTIDPVATGRIRLVNTYFTSMTIIVNDRSIRLAPGATEMIDIPAGQFTYEVLGVQPAYVRTVAANETYTITVYPR